MDKGKITLVLVAVLAVSVLTQGFTSNPLGGANKEKIKAEAKDYIAKNLMAGQEDSFEVKEVNEEGGLYKLTVDVDGREVTSYMTKDRSIFFPSALEMNPEVAGEQDEQTAEQTEEIPQTDNPEVELYLMSFCPYGNQAEELMKPVAELLGDSADIQPHYIFYDDYQGGGPEFCIDEESKYCSMHGAPEANQNIRELCVFNNQNDKYWDFITQVNADCDYKNVDECWTGPAEEVGVDVGSVENCFEDNKLAYAEGEVKLTTEKKVSGSPTLLINGVRFSGERSVSGYKEAVCGAFNEAPEACSETLEEPEGSASAGSCN